MNKIYIYPKQVIDRSKLVPAQESICSGSGSKQGHNPGRPIFHWLQHTPVGKELFIALYTKKCRWARCSFCSLPSVSSSGEVKNRDIVTQVNYVLSQLSAPQKYSVRRIFLSNNGSILDTGSMPVSVLDHILNLLNNALPNLAIFELETRFDSLSKDRILSLVDKLRCLSSKTFRRSTAAPLHLQISAGYETQDPFLRNNVLCKGYPEELVQGSYCLLADIRKITGYPVGLDENVLLKPAAFLSDRDAVAECAETVRHVQRLGRYFDLPVSARINPVFVATGSLLHRQFLAGNFKPPSLQDVVRVLRLLQKNVHIPIHIGMNEEELDVAGGSFNSGSKQDKILRRILEDFNRTGDYGVLGSKLYFNVLDTVEEGPHLL